MIRFIAKLWRAFASMTQKDKIFVVALSLVFLVNTTQYINQHRSRGLTVAGEIYTEAFVGDIKLINPLFTDFNDADRDVSRLVFSGLMRYDSKDHNFYPDLAEKIERKNNGKEIIITLRPNATWHDNVPVSTDDVMFTYRDIIQNQSFRNPVLKNDFASVSVEKIDDKTVAFKLPQPNSYFISSLTVGILPFHIFGESDFATIERSGLNKNPIGTGPYKVTSSSIDGKEDYVDLEAYDGYYGTKPTIARIRLVTFKNEEDLFANTKYSNGIAKTTSLTKPDEDFVLNANEYTYSVNQFTALYFNTDNRLLNVLKIRRALFRTLNKNDLVVEGEKRIDTIELKDKQTDPAFIQDTVAAGKVFDELGYIKSPEDGIRRSSTGELLQFTILTHKKIPESIALGLQSQWEKAGVKILIQNVELDEYQRLLEQRRYDIVINKQNLGYNFDLYPLLHSSQAYYEDQKPGLNLSNIKSFKIDTLTEALRKESDTESKEKMYVSLSQTVAEEAPVVFLSIPVYSYWLPKSYGAFEANALNYHSDRFSSTPYLLKPLTTSL